MVSRALDWFKQAARDLEQAVESKQAGRHEWACFAGQQAAEKAVKALHLSLGQEAWGHVIARLLEELPETILVPANSLIRPRYWIISIFRPGTRTAIPWELPSNITVQFKVRRLFPMPVRSLHSSVLKWPDKQAVDQAVRAWAQLLASEHPEIIGIAYFGSYARGDWGVGSDLDVVVIIRNSNRPFEERSREYDAQKLPVPTDLVVYTLEEWRNLDQEQPFYRRLRKEAVWVYGSG